MTRYELEALFTLKDNFSYKMKNIKVSSEKIQESMKKLENRTYSVGNKFTTMADKGLRAFKWLGVGATGLGVVGTKIAGDFQTLSSQMKTAFQGDEKRAKEYYSWANKFANITPFSNEEVVGATVKLSMQGFDPKKVLSDIGDMAGAMGKSLDQSFEAFADASRGEWERLKEFGITKQNIVDEADKLGFKDVFDNKGSLRDTDKAMESLLSIMKKRFGGGMKNLQNTLKGQMSTTLGVLKFNVARVFGVMEDGSVRTGSVLERVVNKLKKLNEWFETDDFKQKLDKWIGVFDKSMTQIEEISKKFVDYFKKNFPETIGKFFSDLENFDATSINSGLDKITQNFDKLFTSIQRVAGAYLGFKLGAQFGIKGALIGGGLGLFTPEIMKEIEYLIAQSNKEEEEKEIRDQSVKDLHEKQLDYTVDYSRASSGATGNNYSGYGNTVNITGVTINNTADLDQFTKAITDSLEHSR